MANDNCPQLEHDAQSILDGNFDFILDQIVLSNDNNSNNVDSSYLEDGKTSQHQCHLCLERFTVTLDYRSHLRLHGHQESYQCPICQEAHPSSSKLWRHLTRSHEDQFRSKSLTCTLCDNKEFKQAFNYHLHMLIHLGELPERCRYCPKTFRTKPSLRKHELIHTGVKSHECQKCSSRFKTRDELKQHEISHSTEKPWRCDHCLIRFKYQASLKRHVKKGRCLIGKHWCPLEPRKARGTRQHLATPSKIEDDEDRLSNRSSARSSSSSSFDIDLDEFDLFITDSSSVQSSASTLTNNDASFHVVKSEHSDNSGALFCDAFLGDGDSSIWSGIPVNFGGNNLNCTSAPESLFSF